ncbi:hypothetical protein EVC20_129 [Rhizobium phage RHph_Y2_17_1]|nr:hypothetical protein EVC19_129 [Rhizobium phage RHph_Y2_11]QIG75868.1 hypothetical protein EVC20_129 [Rhizobium phage RHph_Y2_17_1]
MQTVDWNVEELAIDQCIHRETGENGEIEMTVQRWRESMVLATVVFNNTVVRNTAHRRLSVARRRCEETRLELMEKHR